MSFTFIESLNSSQREKILGIWNSVFPVNLSKTKNDFDDYLDTLNNQRHILLTGKEDEILAWLFLFTRDNERWFAMILDKKIQGKGHGSTMLNLAKDFENELNGWVIDHNDYKLNNNENYLSPLDFYLKNDFKVISEHRLEKEEISAVKICWSKKD